MSESNYSSVNRTVIKNTVAGITAMLFLLPIPGLAEELASGLRVGQHANQFLVKDCTGPAAGKTLCYYCRYADRPVITLFVREISDDIANLVGRIDRAVSSHEKERLAAFVVFVGKDTPEAEAQLKRLAKRQRLRNTPLTIYRESPQKLADLYRINPDAAVTALVWQERRITVNRAYPASQLSRTQVRDFLKAAESSLKP